MPGQNQLEKVEYFVVMVTTKILVGMASHKYVRPVGNLGKYSDGELIGERDHGSVHPCQCFLPPLLGPGPQMWSLTSLLSPFLPSTPNGRI